MKSIKIDDIDLAILKALQEDSRLGNNELARRINLSQPATHSRVKKLKEQGVIEKFTAQFNHSLLGFELICFFQVTLQVHSEDLIQKFERAVCSFDEVLECHYLTGEFDHLIKAAFKNTQELEQFSRNKLSTLPGVSKIITSIVLTQLKTTSRLPEMGTV